MRPGTNCSTNRYRYAAWGLGTTVLEYFLWYHCVIGIEYIGCFIDYGGRDLPHLHWEDGSMTNEACAAHCTGYTVFGTQVNLNIYTFKYMIMPYLFKLEFYFIIKLIYNSTELYVSLCTLDIGL